MNSGTHETSKLSARDQVNLSNLLKDQYSSSRAKHEPGEEDPLAAASLNYNDQSVTKG